jgi:NADH:ubiquinone reductase (H+-translocating)
MNDTDRPHVVIVGGGFGGLYAAKALQHTPVHVTLVDRRNFHLFQPLLYQVATGGLSAGDIAQPLRAVFADDAHIAVRLGNVVDLDVARRTVRLQEGVLPYDTAIIATGAGPGYFGHNEWAAQAPGLKTVEDALEIRRRILSAFEAAEGEPNPEAYRARLTFVIVGGGPTGVELAGTLAELARGTLKGHFRRIDPAAAQIILVEHAERLLPPFPADLSAKAEAALKQLGVTIRTGTDVSDIEDGVVMLRGGDAVERLPAGTVLWAAGVQASPFGQVLAERTGAELDRMGRVKVAPDLTIPGHPNLFVIGDLAHVAGPDGTPLPGLAAVARQQGRYVGELIGRRLRGKPVKPFRYRDRGNLAVIGRHAAVADLHSLHFDGWIAWLLWLAIHIYYLIGFENKFLVMFQWGWNYITRKRGAQLITGQAPWPRVDLRTGSAEDVDRLPHARDGEPHADGSGHEGTARQPATKSVR